MLISSSPAPAPSLELPPLAPIPPSPDVPEEPATKSSQHLLLGRSCWRVCSIAPPPHPPSSNYLLWPYSSLSWCISWGADDRKNYQNLFFGPKLSWWIYFYSNRTSWNRKTFFLKKPGVQENHHFSKTQKSQGGKLKPKLSLKPVRKAIRSKNHKARWSHLQINPVFYYLWSCRFKGINLYILVFYGAVAQLEKPQWHCGGRRFDPDRLHQRTYSALLWMMCL